MKPTMKCLVFLTLTASLVEALNEEGYKACGRNPQYFKDLPGDLELDAKLVITDREDIAAVYEAREIEVRLMSEEDANIDSPTGFSYLEPLTKPQLVDVLEKCGINASATEKKDALLERFASLASELVKAAHDEVIS